MCSGIGVTNCRGFDPAISRLWGKGESGWTNPHTTWVRIYATLQALQSVSYLWLLKNNDEQYLTWDSQRIMMSSILLGTVEE